MSMQNGVMTMRPVQGGLEIKPGQTVVLKPESLHLMLIGFEQSLVKGEHVKATTPLRRGGRGGRGVNPLVATMRGDHC
jgi:copper(I)-binding protein